MSNLQSSPSPSYLQNDPPSQQRLDFNPLPQPTNGVTHPSRNTRTPDGTLHGQSKHPTNLDPSYLSPYKQGARPDLSGSRSGSEADSLIDLYGHPRSTGERSLDGSMYRNERVAAQDESFVDDDDPERSRWIHRDKLAIIESHEMQEAGIQLPPQHTRSGSKSKGRREHIVSQETPEIPSQDLEPSLVRGKKQRIRSPVRQEEPENMSVSGFDIRTPEEIAADNYIASSPTQVYRQPDLRKSSSRIPLPKSSPMPIPQEHLERDTPLVRKRGASGNWTGEENGMSYNRIRSRGNSVGSQVLLDDIDTSNNQSTPTPVSRPTSSGSPTKPRLPSNNRPPQTRRISANNRTPDTAFKARTASNTASPRTPSSNIRPKSRSGLEVRPPTAINRPEGDPPWLATMYKPDPRLPPDQQLLPTHAKRLQQEQWDRVQKEAEQRRLEGKASPQLPREFSPLAEHTVNGLQPSSREADEKITQEQQRGPEWPLTVATSKVKERDQRPMGSSGAGDGGHAGYSTVPRVKEKSPVKSSQPLDPFERERIERDEEKGRRKEGKEKGCSCCIVM